MPITPSFKQFKKAEAALSDTQAKLVDLRTRREAALLEGDDPGPVIALDQETAKLERVAAVQRDRIEALKREAEREEGLARAKRRSRVDRSCQGEDRRGRRRRRRGASGRRSACETISQGMRTANCAECGVALDRQ